MSERAGRVNRRLLVGLAALAAVGAWAWPSVSLRPSHRAIDGVSVPSGTSSVHSASNSGPSDSPHDDDLESDPTVPDMRRDRTVESLLERLASPDPHVVLDAADGLRARRAVVAIPKLVAIDVVASPDPARTVIDALGELAGVANGAERATAVDRLLVLLEQEKRRTSADAPGNVLQIYEALGKTKDERAARALEQELQDTRVPLAAYVVVADALVALGQSASRGPLSAARERVVQYAADTDFDRAVRADVIVAIERALGAL